MKELIFLFASALAIYTEASLYNFPRYGTSGVNSFPGFGQGSIGLGGSTIPRSYAQASVGPANFLFGNQGNFGLQIPGAQAGAGFANSLAGLFPSKSVADVYTRSKPHSLVNYLANNRNSGFSKSPSFWGINPAPSLGRFPGAFLTRSTLLGGRPLVTGTQTNILRTIVSGPNTLPGVGSSPNVISFQNLFQQPQNSLNSFPSFSQPQPNTYPVPQTPLNSYPGLPTQLNTFPVPQSPLNSFQVPQSPLNPFPVPQSPLNPFPVPQSPLNPFQVPQSPQSNFPEFTSSADDQFPRTFPSGPTRGFSNPFVIQNLLRRKGYRLPNPSIDVDPSNSFPITNPGINDPTNQYPISNPGANVPAYPYPSSSPDVNVPQNLYPISNPDTSAPTNTFPISNPGVNFPAYPYPISNPGANVPAYPYPSSSADVNVPQNLYPISNPDTSAPTNTYPISNSGVNYPAYPYPISNPDASAPTNTFPISNTGANFPANLFPISNPGANVPTNPFQISRPDINFAPNLFPISNPGTNVPTNSFPISNSGVNVPGYPFPISNPDVNSGSPNSFLPTDPDDFLATNSGMYPPPSTYQGGAANVYPSPSGGIMSMLNGPLNAGFASKPLGGLPSQNTFANAFAFASAGRNPGLSNTFQNAGPFSNAFSNSVPSESSTDDLDPYANPSALNPFAAPNSYPSILSSLLSPSGFGTPSAGGSGALLSLQGVKSFPFQGGYSGAYGQLGNNVGFKINNYDDSTYKRSSDDENSSPALRSKEEHDE